MKKLSVLVSAAMLLVAVSAFAGSGEKCSYSTQVCLNHWADMKDMGWAGLEFDKSDPAVMKVKAISPESPAVAAGFQVGDVVTAINGVSVSDKASLKKAKAGFKAGSTATYTIKRADAEQQLSVTLAKMPESMFTANLGAHMLENHAVVATAAAEGGAKPTSADKK
jgi:predicted metalloprotease with PDZ domain